jgi:hypothetical protein
MNELGDNGYKHALADNSVSGQRKGGAGGGGGGGPEKLQLDVFIGDIRLVDYVTFKINGSYLRINGYIT